jgi:uncharacterized protein YndB with AHSA1/START domain
MADAPREFTLIRILDAPRTIVWKAWTEPEQLARWWGPVGYTTPLSTIELDLRPGGAFRFTMIADDTGAELPTVLECREIVEPERLVYLWPDQRGLGAGEFTVTFAELGDRTEMRTRFVGYASDAIAAMARRGWSSQLDRLAELMASLNQGDPT